MIPNRYRKQVRTFIRNSRLRRSLLGGIAFVFLFGMEFLSVLPLEYTLVAFIFIGILYLDILEEQTLSVTDMARSIETTSDSMEDDLEDIKQRANKIGNDLNPVAVYPHEDSLAPELQRIIPERSPDHVFMLDYSSKKGEYIINEARKEDAEIFLLIKNPNHAVRNYQRERIIRQLTHSLFAMFDEYENLHVGLYNETGSVRARIIGDECVCVGWYRYECTGPEHREKIWGHNNPTFLLTADDQAFEETNRWLREKVMDTHWENGTDLETLFDAGELPEVEEWVHEESTTEREVEKKLEYIDQISGSADDAQQVLFD